MPLVMSDPLIDPADLGTYLNDSAINNDRATLMIQLAQAKCETILSPLPAGAVNVVMDVAARGYVTTRQSRGPQMARAGSLYDESGGSRGGIWLTRENETELHRLSGGSSGSFSIDLLPADYAPPYIWHGRY